MIIEVRIVLLVFNFLLKLWRIPSAREHKGLFLGVVNVLYHEFDNVT